MKPSFFKKRRGPGIFYLTSFLLGVFAWQVGGRKSSGADLRPIPPCKFWFASSVSLSLSLSLSSLSGLLTAGRGRGVVVYVVRDRPGLSAGVRSGMRAEGGRERTNENHGQGGERDHGVFFT